MRQKEHQGIKAEIDKLRQQVSHHDQLYYEKDSPEISDAEYDELRRKLENLEAAHPELRDLFSPVSKVGATPSSKFKKVKHLYPMLSLANAFTREDVADFMDRVKKFLNINGIELIAELKIDGISFSAIYENGRLKVASTRGDGEYGEDITENIKTISSFPQQVSFPSNFEVRGEIYIDKDDFLSVNEARKNSGEETFANPRNFAAGSLRQLDPQITRSRNLKYFIWGGNLPNCTSQYDLLVRCQNLGFSVNPEIKKCTSVEELINYYDNASNTRAELAYDIDGIVYKVNKFELQSRLGAVSRSPRWAMAHKFPAEKAITQVKNIILQVGRTGALTPVAILDPVGVGGVLVSRATLHNEEEIARKDVRVGDTVLIQRAGDVIPQVLSVDITKRPAASPQFQMPDKCPICGNEATKDPHEVIRRCTGGLKCQAQVVERIKHFISRDAFNIEGLGDKQVEEFFAKNLLRTPVDIFRLQEKAEIQTINTWEGWGAKSVQNLWVAIEKAKTISLDKFIYSLGIRYVGEANAKLLAKNFGTLTHLIEACQNKDSLLAIDGIGDKVAMQVIKFFTDQYYLNLIHELEKYIIIQSFVAQTVVSHFSGKRLVFTGTLSKMGRGEAKSLAEKLGAMVSSTISSKTDYLICGEDGGSKMKKAQELGVKILNEGEWTELAKVL